MSVKVVVGAGAVGVPAALLLAEAGHEVRLVSRHGSGPDHPGIEPPAHMSQLRTRPIVAGSANAMTRQTARGQHHLRTRASRL